MPAGTSGLVLIGTWYQVPGTTQQQLLFQARLLFWGNASAAGLIAKNPTLFTVRFFLTVRCGAVRFNRTAPHRTILPLTKPHRAAL